MKFHKYYEWRLYKVISTRIKIEMEYTQKNRFDNSGELCLSHPQNLYEKNFTCYFYY